MAPHPRLASIISVVCVLVLLASRCLTNISLPLWLDTFNSAHSNTTNSSVDSVTLLPSRFQGIDLFLEIASTAADNQTNSFAQKIVDYSLVYSSVNSSPTKFRPLSLETTQSSTLSTSTTTSDHVTLPFFTAAFPSVACFLPWPVLLFCIHLLRPHKITEFDRRYPRKWLLLPGCAEVCVYCLNDKIYTDLFNDLVGSYISV